LALARYNTNGTLDSSLGSGGEATTDFNGLSQSKPRTSDSPARPRGKGVSRTDAARIVVKSGAMKKRLLITGLVLAALLLALYGIVFGTGAK
jgi:hypothetical protein